MRRVGIDCRFASTHSGLGRYTREIVTHLLKRQDPVEYVLFVRSPGEEWLQRCPRTNCTLQVTNIPHYSLREQLLFPLLIARAGIDLFYAPHFNVPFFCPTPFIVTIHDLILHRYPNQATFLRRTAYRFLMARSLKKAKRIIAVSAFTASEVRNAYGRNATVISEGVDPVFHPRSHEEIERVRIRYDLKLPFFLYVGNAKEHKNVQTLTEAFRSLQNSTSELVLVVNGSERTSLSNVSGVRILHDLPDDDLAALYTAALCFVTASLYEGFCLPVAEAFACGCPVIAAHSAAMSEVAADRAFLIDPTVQAFSAALKVPPQVRSAVTLHTWDSIASQVSDILLASDCRIP